MACPKRHRGQPAVGLPGYDDARRIRPALLQDRCECGLHIVGLGLPVVFHVATVVAIAAARLSKAFAHGDYNGITTLDEFATHRKKAVAFLCSGTAALFAVIHDQQRKRACPGWLENCGFQIERGAILSNDRQHHHGFIEGSVECDGLRGAAERNETKRCRRAEASDKHGEGKRLHSGVMVALQKTSLSIVKTPFHRLNMQTDKFARSIFKKLIVCYHAAGCGLKVRQAATGLNKIGPLAACQCGLSRWPAAARPSCVWPVRGPCAHACRYEVPAPQPTALFPAAWPRGC